MSGLSLVRRLQRAARDARQNADGPLAARITPYEALSNPAVAMGLEQFAALRMLRLWHWRQVLSCRAFARRAAFGAAAFSAATYDAEANQHLRFVQLLNDFFPAGDTAERDAAAV